MSDDELKVHVPIYRSLRLRKMILIEAYAEDPLPEEMSGSKTKSSLLGTTLGKTYLCFFGIDTEE